MRGKLHYFGRWGNSVAGELVIVDDFDRAARDAEDEYKRDWHGIVSGRGRSAYTTGRGGKTIHDITEWFFLHNKKKQSDGELSAFSLNEYYRVCVTVEKFFGPDRHVADLSPFDFENLRAHIGKDCTLVTLRGKINRIRVLFSHAHKYQLIDRPVSYGAAFDRPKDLHIRGERNRAGERLFERVDLLRMLTLTDGKPITVGDDVVTLPKSPPLRAMLLLGLNAGFGNTDVSSLPQSAVNLATGWISFPRPKTQIQRKVPLWPETVAAITEALVVRPAPKDPADANLCFLTERGTPFVRLQQSKTNENRQVCINAIARRFEALIRALKIDGRRGLGFYTLRHVFETVAGESRDQVSVDSIMGHVDSTMGGQYRERISEERLRAVVDHVHDWLFGPQAKPVQKSSAKSAAKSA
ncbi:MAG: site-specific integrase [Planctomycetaceae bacterium]|nr:site-specific integrase [Planctomycetaceae bacterium]